MYGMPTDAILYASDSHGVYIPQLFAQSVTRECVAGIDAEQYAILEAGPDHELYWTVWCEVEAAAELTDPQGKAWRLYQDGDLWLVPEDWQPED